jgi:hypothetical protein
MPESHAQTKTICPALKKQTAPRTEQQTTTNEK